MSLLSKNRLSMLLTPWSAIVILGFGVALSSALVEIYGQNYFGQGQLRLAALLLDRKLMFWMPAAFAAGLVFSIFVALLVRLFPRFREYSRSFLSRRPWAPLVLAGLLLAAGGLLRLGLFLQARAFNPAIPRVIIISVDTLRADHLGCYGNERVATPGMDSLARKGLLFEQAYSAAPVTAPSHASIFTGLYPTRHGVRDNGSYSLAPEQLTMAEILANQGYQTAAFVSSFVLDRRFGMNQGFEHYDDDMSEGKPYDKEWVGHQVANFERDARQTNRKFLSWLSARPDRPFFVWVHYFDPHFPYAPPEPWATEYVGRPYEGEIAAVDRAISELLAELDRRGLGDDTLIVLMSDHGEGLGEHENTHGLTLYDPLIHVPLIFVAPGARRQGVRVARQVRTIDVLPTVLELLMIDGPKVEGVSLAEMFSADASGPDLPAYSETHHLERPYQGGIMRSARTPDYKFITQRRDNIRLLYDLGRDPGELVDVYLDRPGPAARMQALVDEVIAGGGDFQTSEEQDMDPETVEKLRALGYIQD